MKNKLLILNIASYIVVYHLVFETVLSMYDFDETSKVSTPIVRLFRYYIINQKVYENYEAFDIYLIAFNLLISGIVIFAIYKPYLRRNLFVSVLMLIASFGGINILLLIYVVYKYDFATSFIYVSYVLIPLTIMVSLILPLFYLNRRILFGKDQSKNRFKAD